MPHFDLIIVGTGVAGRTAAEEAARAGLNTAVVDCRPFGGTCALRGCEPKKILVAAAEAAMRARGQNGHGVTGDARIDWSQLRAFKRGFIDELPKAFETGIREAGQTPVCGTARFTSPDTLDIGGQSYTADAIFLGTGAKPALLGMPGEELLIDSEEFMDLTDMPERIVFVGGGFISFEFAAVAASAGARPVILHRGAHPLKGFDPDLADALVAQYAEWEIPVRVNTPVASVRRGDYSENSPFVVELADGSRLSTDLVVHGAGRVPDLDPLDLATGGVEFGPLGVTVEPSMRSVSNPRVWAAGDAAAGGPPLTPVGVSQARAALANIVSPGSTTWSPGVIPSAVFSQPPLAAVGLSEAEAKARGLDVEVKFTDTSAWLSSQRVGLKHSGAKTIVERGTCRILGAHVLGYHAEETINLFALAITAEQTVDDLKRVLWAYPTAASEIVYLL
jgi:glutathione reductase (NADPH)